MFDDRGGRAVGDVVDEGISGFLPTVEASTQGANAVDAHLVKLESELGAGLFAGAGAVEDDVAITRKNLAVQLQLVGSDAQGAG